jgi:NADH-ubiquinone oxidoreductase chain 6
VEGEERVVLKDKYRRLKKITTKMTSIFINLLVIGMLFSSVLSITSKNPVISVIFLITTFVSAAAYLILIGINFIGISYIVIYVGAIAVLFLFVIMMINIKLTDILDTGYNYTKNLPLAILIVTLFIFIIFQTLPFSFNNITLPFNFSPSFSILPYSFHSLWTMEGGEDYNLISNQVLNFSNLTTLINRSQSDILLTQFEQIQVLGHNLYTYGAILLIELSIILLLAMLSTIIISKNNKNI